MNKGNEIILRKPGQPDRICYPFPWVAPEGCPYNASTHQRVMLPLSKDELKSAKPGTRAHVLIVRRDKIFPMKGVVL